MALNIIIVGGGLSGALLANGLLSNAIPFTIYERDTADSKREGYQIRLGESAMVGFEACLPNDRMELIMKRFGQSSGSTATAPALFNTRWEEVIDLAVMPTYSKSAAINRVVLRDLLLEPVKKAGRVKYDKAFDRYSIFLDDRGREKVRVHFKDGTSDVCDILIGADGSGSRINAQLGAGNLVPLTTHFSFVSKGELPQERLKQLPQRLLKGPILLFKGTVSMYYALYLPSNDNPDVNDPSQGGKRDSGVDYDQRAASFYWGIHIPRTEVPYAKPSDIPNTHEFVLEKLREWGWAKELQDLVRIGSDDKNANVEAIQFRASKPLKKNWRETLRRGAVGHAHSDGIGSSRVWLMGDAVHAMQPNRGQGGNQSLHDAADLLPEILALNDIAKSLDDNTALPTAQIEQACRRYESTMFDRAFPWVRKSGGTSFVSLDLDGVLGTIAKLVSWTILPVVRMVYRVCGIRG